MNATQEEGAHVAMLLPELRIGGAQRVILTLAKEFTARGVRVDLVLLSKEGELLTEIPSKVRLIPLVDRPFSKGIISITQLVVNLARYLRNNRPDTLLSTLTGTNLLAVIAHGLSNVKTQLVLREAAPLANLRKPYSLLLMRWLYKRADKIIVLSDFMKKEMEEKLKIPSNKIRQISNPVDVERIKKAAEESLPDDFDFSFPYIIAVGRLAPQKDYMTLLDAFFEVAKTFSLKLVILGEGPDRALLEKRIRDLSLCGRVELRGVDSNPYRWIARSSVFVLSSLWEGYPNVLLEALLLEKTVVSTIYDDSVRSIMVNQRGCLVPVGDASALAKAISNSLRGFPHPITRSLHAEVTNASIDYLKTINSQRVNPKQECKYLI